MTTSTLIAAKSGNVSELNALLMETRSYAIAVVSKFLGTKYSARIDAEDVSQIVLTQVARDLATCNATDMASYFGWVRLVARNCVYKEVEKIKAAKRSADRTHVIGDDFQVTGRTQTPVEILESREQLAAVMALAAGVSDLTKNVVVLLGEGNDSAAIADQLGITVSAVYGVVKRFRQACKAELVS